MNTSYIYKGAHTLNPYINIKGCVEAIEFYKKAFGAVEVYRLAAPDGSIAHAEIQIEGSLLMLAEENPSWKNTSPTTLGGTTCTLCLYVPDVDTFFKKAIEAGGKETMPVTDMFYGDRAGCLIDPYGHKWMISTHKVDMSPEEIQKGADKMFAAGK